MSGSIVAVGGGGFLMEDTRGLQERYLLSLARQRVAAPHVLYLGTANGDSERAQLRFMRMFTQLGCRPDTLAFFPYDMKRDYTQAVRDADLVYVGGGNTVAMVAVWREFGFDATLRAAWDNGTVLAGISAGANCWFAHYVTDSMPGGGVGSASAGSTRRSARTSMARRGGNRFSRARRDARPTAPQTASCFALRLGVAWKPSPIELSWRPSK